MVRFVVGGGWWWFVIFGGGCQWWGEVEVGFVLSVWFVSSSELIPIYQVREPKYVPIFVLKSEPSVLLKLVLSWYYLSRNEKNINTYLPRKIDRASELISIYQVHEPKYVPIFVVSNRNLLFR